MVACFRGCFLKEEPSFFPGDRWSFIRTSAGDTRNGFLLLKCPRGKNQRRKEVAASGVYSTPMVHHSIPYFTILYYGVYYKNESEVNGTGRVWVPVCVCLCVWLPGKMHNKKTRSRKIPPSRTHGIPPPTVLATENSQTLAVCHLICLKVRWRVLAEGSLYFSSGMRVFLHDFQSAFCKGEVLYWHLRVIICFIWFGNCSTVW